MTLKQCLENVGSKVIYKREFCKQETGVITSVNDTYAFIRYGSDVNSKATNPADLILEV